MKQMENCRLPLFSDGNILLQNFVLKVNQAKVLFFY
jgi:hypothetical protein